MPRQKQPGEKKAIFLTGISPKAKKWLLATSSLKLLKDYIEDMATHEPPILNTFDVKYIENGKYKIEQVEGSSAQQVKISSKHKNIISVRKVKFGLN